ncbi:response regulator transcription factor [Flavobacterium sp.]|uniref:response regulator transcription factor n=1 Tax=Flavobacterium sp. TaxID=239 RepID=UPI003A907115
MRILIVDDSIDKISNLSKLIFSSYPKAVIESSENVANAVSLISNQNKYDLVVIDLLLPLKFGDPPKIDGGKFLLNEIYRKINSIKLPGYIVGFSQIEDCHIDFSTIWNVIKYRENDNWRFSFNQLLNHINGNINDTTESKITPTIFVEGLTDKYYIQEALNLFSQDKSSEINIISQKNAGANWVANQISIWAMGLKKDANGYIKSVGLLDFDEAGNIAKSHVDKRNLSDNEKQCFSLFQLKASYNSSLLLFFQNKCKIEIEIESLFSIDILKYAEDNDWLEYRPKPFQEHPKDWKQLEENIFDYLTRKNIPSDSLLYLKKVKISKKDTFRRYIDSLTDKNDVYKNFKILIEELLLKLKVT